MIRIRFSGRGNKYRDIFGRLVQFVFRYIRKDLSAQTVNLPSCVPPSLPPHRRADTRTLLALHDACVSLLRFERFGGGQHAGTFLVS